MKIGIDAHSLGTGAGGNETYMRALLGALRAFAPETDVLAYVCRGAAADPGAAAGFPMCAMRARSSYLRVPFVLPWAVWRTRPDLLHVQFNAPPYCPCPFVASVHDVCWERYPELLPAADRYRLKWLAPGTLRRARRVFVLTEAIRGELSDICGVPMEKIDVVPPAVDPLFRPVEDAGALAAVRHKYRLPSDYILYVGALQPRKNLVRLARAFARLEGRGLSHRLVIVGKRAWLHKHMLAEIDALELGDRLVFTGYAARCDLPALLSGAAAFAYVSVYEGFGIPLLEAMTCGAPVVASVDAAIREVVGDAAVLCDPHDEGSIEEGLVRVLTDSNLRARLHGEGLKRAASYDQKRMAQAALDGYHKALE